jgi:hypothetical protein
MATDCSQQLTFWELAAISHNRSRFAFGDAG